MTYCALLVPQDKNKKEEKDLSFFEKITGKLMSGVNDGGLNFENATTVLKNTAKLVSESSDTILNKFSGIALAQLLKDGKITNETALGYLTQGFPKALGFSSVAMGFQSVDQLITSLKSKNGVNVQQFISSFQNFGGALSEMFDFGENKKNIEGFDTIEIDATMSDNRDYSSETPDRRVEKGQTYQEFIHNLPDILSLECVLQNGRRYDKEEFEDLILNIRQRKVAINIILGDVIKESLVITRFNPNRELTDGYHFGLELKKINVGSVDIVTLENNIQSSITKNIIPNQLFKGLDNKTESAKSNGWKASMDNVFGWATDSYRGS